MFDWEHTPVTDGRGNHLGIKLGTDTLHEGPYQDINVYGGFTIFNTYDEYHRKQTPTELRVSVERYWEYPYVAADAAQRTYLFLDLSLKEADEKLREMLEHMRACPEVEASNGGHHALCSHYEDHEFNRVYRAKQIRDEMRRDKQ